jgi:hypothetical protein
MSTLYAHQLWERAHLYHACATCMQLCCGPPLVVCVECCRVYHVHCVAMRNLQRRCLDCTCDTTRELHVDLQRQCLRTSCTQIADCVQTRYWTCTACFKLLQTAFETFILTTQKNDIALPAAIFSFRRIPHVGLPHTHANESNPLFRLIVACLTEVIMAAPLLAYRRVSTDYSTSHVFRLCVQDMRQTGKPYTMPLHPSMFSILQSYQYIDQPDFAKQFRLYLRECSNAINTPIRFISTDQVIYSTTLHIHDKPGIMHSVHKSGLAGLSRQVILQEYARAVSDLQALETENKVYITGDRQMVYDPTCFAPVLPGLAAAWQKRPNPTKTLSMKCSSSAKPGCPAPNNM